MYAILRFFEGIGDAIVSALGFLVSLVQDLVYFIQSLGWAIAQIPTFLGWLPEEATGLCILLIMIVIACRVIGRD